MRAKRGGGVRWQWLVLLALVAACTPRSGRQNATLVRDEFGVPHIFAENEVAAMYVHGYAQAEDRLEQILRHYRWAEGTLAEVLGKRYLSSDYDARMWRHAEVSREKFSTLPESTRRMLEAFVAGIEAYMEEHPEKVPDWAPEIHPWHVVALARAFIWGWPEGQARGDLNRKRPVPKVKTRGSNQWALAGERTASGKPILLIDPHLSWDPDGKWTEVRIHAGDLQIAGMVIPGMPLIALGHNRYVGWAATTGGPDCGDIYAIETDPRDPLRYKYDGRWRRMRVDSVRLGYRDGDEIQYETRAIERSHLGPIVKREGRIAYAMAIPYENEVLIVETLVRMCKAKSVDDLKAALAMQQFLPQNIMAADVHGNIYYQRTGRVPIRPEGFDFRYPVPGNTSATAWKGLHPTSDLVQILNPAAGYMQNCNISPGTMIHEGAPDAEDYPAYIFNASPTGSNPRGRRAVSLLRRAKDVAVEQAMRIAFDTTVDPTEVVPWQRALQQAYNDLRPDADEALREAVALVVNWNRSVDRDNEAAVLFRVWREQVENLAGRQRLSVDSRLNRAQKQTLLTALQAAIDWMQATYGAVRVPWGKTLRLQRGDKDLPLGGAGYGRIGMSTLRNIWARKKAGPGVSAATGGQSCPMLVHFTDPIESYSILPFGISDDPSSPHHIDQMGLFASKQMKPTWFDRRELQEHTVSRREFRAPSLEKAAD